MNRFISHFWFGLALVAIVCLLMVGSFASGQVVASENEPVLLSGFLSCGTASDGTRLCPFRLHYVELERGRTYMIRMDSTDYNSSLVLEDMSGKELARDDDAYDALYGVMVFRPTVSGSYRLIASCREPLEGYYTISIRELPVILRVEEALEPDAAVSNDCFERVYEVGLTAGRRYILDMASDEFAPFVKVLNAEGMIVAFEDECGAMRNTRVVFEPIVTGTYRIVATSYEPRATGTFRLVVCAE